MNTDAFYRPTSIDSSSITDFLYKVYSWMAVGLGITGAVAWFTAQAPQMLELLVQNRVIFFGLLIAQLGLVAAFSAVAHRASTATAAAMFVAYSALTGLTFSTLFLIYTSASIAQTFFITGGSFAGLSAFGLVTKKDLSGVGRFMLFGLIGVIIASIVNIFMNSPAIYWITTYAGVLIFAGLTAYDTQKLKALYTAAGEGGNLALRGALTLYLDFVNLFLFMLRLLGNRRS
ncbi:MAG: Bax inhibitor-1/YccA family protein [Deltaproteobacteria bacterium]|nr:Bax inhibitor-1/YccA family protein [Deltaproteobacteria bacterium]